METKSGLPGAHVRINSTPAQATSTDELGIFSFVDLPSGEFTISISYIGFGDTSVIVTVKDHETTPIKVGMASREINLPDVNITAEANANLQTISALVFPWRASAAYQPRPAPSHCCKACATSS